MVLADGKPYKEDILYADIEPAMAREKHVIVRLGELEYHVFNDRRPEFYGPIVSPIADTSRIRWGETIDQAIEKYLKESTQKDDSNIYVVNVNYLYSI